MRIYLGVFVLLMIAAEVAAQDITKVDPQHYRLIFENSHLRVIEGRDKPGDKTPMHHHPASLSYVDGPVTTKIVTQDGRTIVDGPSDKVWCSPPSTHAVENIGTTNTHEVMIEFKDFDPCEDGSGPQATQEASQPAAAKSDDPFRVESQPDGSFRIYNLTPQPLPVTRDRALMWLKWMEEGGINELRHLLKQQR